MNIRKLFIVAAGLLTVVASDAKEALKKNQVFVDYIEKYHKIAVSDMKEYGIPASITLAQGLLESGAGNSQLAKESNNHFGIKCHDWKGDRVYFDDDEKGECFRKYKDPKESYKDHALFLVNRPRYASLFQLSSTDYKGWARGLKSCGYATDPNYATRLIDVIETYGLAEYDKDVKPKKKEKKEKETTGEKDKKQEKTKNTDEKKKGGAENYLTKSSMGEIALFPEHKVITQGRKQMVVAQKNDTYESIAREFGLKKWEIRWYNKAKKGDVPQSGQMVVIKKW